MFSNFSGFTLIQNALLLPVHSLHKCAALASLLILHSSFFAFVFIPTLSTSTLILIVCSIF